MDECLLYADPQLYDRLFPPSDHEGDPERRARLRASENFYIEEARRACGGLRECRVMELACGSGRLTVQLAQAGIDVTGADLSASMLAAARAKAIAAGLAIEFVQADMRDFALARSFSAILIPGNSLCHLLTPGELVQCFRHVREHLAPGGRLIFDVSKWDLARLTMKPDERHPVLTTADLSIEETAEYDSATQVRRIVWYAKDTTTGETREIEHTLRVIFPQELLLLIERTGFRLDVRYGEFTREPFGPASPRQVCICSKVD